MHNGVNTNPTYLGHCYLVNSVILGQASISRKSKIGGGEGEQLPMNHEAKSMALISK